MNTVVESPRRLRLLFAVAAVALLATALHAQVIYVNAAATGANNGTSWTNAYTDLQSALGLPSPQTIWVAAATYKPGSQRTDSFHIDGKTLYGGFAGTETLLSQRDLASHPTILSGEIGDPALVSDNVANLVRLDSGSATIDGFVITSAYTSGANFPASNFGGGILAFSQSPNTLTIANCRIVNNYSPGDSAGVFADTPTTVVTTVFSGNVSGTGSSLEFFAGGSVTNCTFAGNYDQGGGTLRWANGSQPTIQNTIIWQNVYGSGTDPANLTATNSIIETRMSAYPMFVDAGAGDFHLAPGSPAIDAGAANALTIDADGAPRVSGASVDIGAFEFSSNRLTVTRTGSGTGTVTSVPAAINCGTTCAATLTPGDTYQLTATADSGFLFLGWAGACSGAGACSVQVPANVSAHFGHVWFVNASASGGGDGTSWATAFTDLQTALASAAVGDEIWVAAGTYHPDAANTGISFNLRNGVAVYGGFAGTETNRDQRNVSSNVTTLSGDLGANGHSSTVVQAVAVDAGALLDGFTITGGSGGTQLGGGGAYFQHGCARIAHCTITGNYAPQFGGGIDVTNSGGMVSDCVIANNSVDQNYFGSGVYMQSANSFVLIDSTIVNNSAGDGQVSINGGYPLVDRCRIRQSSDGLSVVELQGQGGPLLRNSEIAGANTFFPIVTSQSYGTILNCTIVGADNHGSAAILRIVSNWPTNVLNTIIWGNTPPVNNFYEQGIGTVANNISTVDPLFATGDVSNGNFRPHVGSPAVDAGNNSYAAASLLDLDDKPRRVDDPQTADTGVGSAPFVDIGAYELHPVTVSVPASIGACPGSQVTLTATPVGIAPFTYQWRKGGSAIGGATGASYFINSYVSGTNAGLYDVIVTDTLGSTATSSQINVHDGTPPSISGFTPGNGAGGTPVTINGSGFTGVTDVKFNGVSGTITNITDAQLTVTVPLAATTGQITVSTAGCQATSTGTFTIPPFGAPVLTAIKNSQRSISLSWTRVGGISGYAVMRLADPIIGYQTLTTTGNPAFVDTTTQPDHAYVYRIDAIPAGAGVNAQSNHGLVVTFVFTESIVQNVTGVKASQWTELRNAVNAVHVLAGDGTFDFTNTVATGQPIRLQDLADLRTALTNAFNDLGLPPVSFADTLQAGLPIRKQHVDEIRNALQ